MKKQSKVLYEEQRRYPRFLPDPLETALISFDTEGEFRPERVALIVDMHPYGGCGLVVTAPFSMKVGEICRIRIGSLSPLLSELRWSRAIDSETIRLGFKFLE